MIARLFCITTPHSICFVGCSANPTQPNPDAQIRSFLKFFGHRNRTDSQRELQSVPSKPTPEQIRLQLAVRAQLERQKQQRHVPRCPPCPEPEDLPRTREIPELEKMDSDEMDRRWAKNYQAPKKTIRKICSGINKIRRRSDAEFVKRFNPPISLITWDGYLM
jgi:hypothetical protein